VVPEWRREMVYGRGNWHEKSYLLGMIFYLISIPAVLRKFSVLLQF